MDPKACLTEADQAISDGELDRAHDALVDYAEWRARGGFEPIEIAGSGQRGDKFYGYCQDRLATARLHEKIAEHAKREEQKLLLSARKVEGGTVTLMDDGEGLWSVNIYQGKPSEEHGKFGEWKSGRSFSVHDAAIQYFRECVK